MGALVIAAADRRLDTDGHGTAPSRAPTPITIAPTDHRARGLVEAPTWAFYRRGIAKLASTVATSSAP